MQFNNVFTIIFLVFLFLSMIIKLILDIINYKHRKKNKNKIPHELEGLIDQNKLLKINNYSNEQLTFSLIEYFFDKIFILIILFTGLIPIYYDFLRAITLNVYLLALLFFWGFLIIQIIFDIPFSLYFNFLIEKKYQFNKMTAGIWIMDLIKKIVLTFVLSTIILIPLVFFVYKFENIWWLLLWTFFLLFSLIIQIFYPTVIAPLFNKFKSLNDLELKNKIEKLAKDTGFKLKGIFEMDASKRSTHSNAYFTGIGKTKRIVLFDSLLQKHSHEEILSILAHEIGHYKHKHVIKNLLISSITSLIGLFIGFLLINNRYLYEAFGFKNNIDVINIKFIGLFLLIIISDPISFFLNPFQSYISRKFEYQADKYSAKILKTTEYLIDSLKKLNIDNLSNIYPADIYAWFYYSHPPLFKRIRALKNYRS